MRTESFAKLTTWKSWTVAAALLMVRAFHRLQVVLRLGYVVMLFGIHENRVLCKAHYMEILNGCCSSSDGKSFLYTTDV